MWLAEGEKELGLDISDEAISQMRSKTSLTEQDFEIAAIEEKRRRHDVMAHVHTFGLAAPSAAGIIHWGATSCYVTDGADQIIMARGLKMLLPKLATVVKKLSNFALEYKDLPTLAYTHGQPAQPTTVGKRAALWIKDLLSDLRNFEYALKNIEFRGVKGTTGTQASFLAIFNGDHAKVEALDEFVTKKAGFETVLDIASQTYSRKQDLDMASAFSSFGATCMKVGGDLRHLAMIKEIEEPFEEEQIGSSAMAYKRNPMRAERMCSIGRHLADLNQDAIHTYASQWFERDLSDSAIRRINIPEWFLCTDALLIIFNNVTSGLVVYPALIERRLMDELPFMATENIIMALVAKGVSRQEAHERIRVHSHAAGRMVKREGKDNDLIERVKGDKYFEPVWEELSQLLDPKSFIGRAPQQVEKFTAPGGPVDKALEPYKDALTTGAAAELKV